MLRFVELEVFFKKSIFPGISRPAGASTQTLLLGEGWLLPGSPSLLERPKSARMAPPGAHGLQVQLWRASTPRRCSYGRRPRSAGAALAGVPTLQEQILLLGGGRCKSDAGEAYIC
jgi:hypothetical protein